MKSQQKKNGIAIWCSSLKKPDEVQAKKKKIAGKKTIETRCLIVSAIFISTSLNICVECNADGKT